MKDLLIIIPAYNEEHNITPLLEALSRPEISSIADVLVMNDASSDFTNQIVRAHKMAVITHVYNLGYGGGLQLGYKYAVRRHYRYIIQMDADGQHDICNVPRLYEALKTPDESGKCPDIVLGSRFVEGSQSFPISTAKKVAFRYFRLLIRGLTGTPIMDPTTGLQGLSRRAFLMYSKFSQFDDKYPDTNMIVQMLLMGYSLKEVPAVMHARTEGESMHSGFIKPFLYMFRMTLSVMSVWLRVRILKLDKQMELWEKNAG